ncbi:hypothetical protein ACOSQ3_014072 [Xanthoceras sorbifolium]
MFDREEETVRDELCENRWLRFDFKTFGVDLLAVVTLILCSQVYNVTFLSAVAKLYSVLGFWQFGDIATAGS